MQIAKYHMAEALGHEKFQFSAIFHYGFKTKHIANGFLFCSL